MRREHRREIAAGQRRDHMDLCHTHFCSLTQYCIETTLEVAPTSSAFLLRPWYRLHSTAISMSLCMSVYLYQLAYLKNRISKLHKFTVPKAWSSSDDDAIRYVFPGLWTMSCFHIMAHMAISHNSHNSQHRFLANGSEVCYYRFPDFLDPPVTVNSDL